ncbi:hypothetical protein M011DRAFT_511079 [Sporormia fimetaria CBS 119925]|uniref:G domain-containing protein n=1 Tax=Sporormia fimetaria CBS 119925 TaxID=1340428 RepID=A0A6A6UYR1_9PLEO|nr:hypothetical protein M011DRAFT_511079 [Sporormia fimetaria CBS 119925]
MASSIGAKASTSYLTSKPAVIVLLGPTGSGKSYFIRAATEDPSVKVGHGLESETQAIAAYHTTIDGSAVLLVDTIGFDGTFQSDADVLRQIATWLAQTYANGVRMAGILYMHDIRSVQFGGSAVKNLRMFEKMLGADALNNTVFVANQWADTCCQEAEAKLNELVQSPKF